MSTPVDTAIETLLASRDSFAMRDLLERTELSRPALHRHLSRWLAGGALERVGAGRSVRYRRLAESELELQYPTAGLAEERVWSELLPALEEHAPDLSREARDILYHTVTELVNNAIDHSGAPQVRLHARISPDVVDVTIVDEGIGALESVRSKFSLDDALHALQELSKGKVTTQPEHHSGEGLFFTSKAVDTFELHANGLAWLVDNERGDFAILEEPDARGTRVSVRLDPQTRRVLQDVFAEYTSDLEELKFDRTRGVVRLFEHGTRFVSRSEAKRLASGLERFREVLVDFKGVDGIGQGFVDQLFRVWASAHPETKLIPVHMNRAVEFMVRRGLP